MIDKPLPGYRTARMTDPKPRQKRVAAAKGRLTRCIAGHLHFEHLDVRGRLMSEMSMSLVQAIDLHIALAEAIHDLAEQMSEGRG